MKSFFVIFGKGILYFLSFPFLVVFLAIFGIYMFLEFLMMSFKTIILFFQGKPLGVKDELDEKAMLILKERKKEALKSSVSSISNITNQNTINQTINNYNINGNPLNNPSTNAQGMLSNNQDEIPLVEGMKKVEPISMKETNNDVVVPLDLEDRND